MKRLLLVLSLTVCAGARGSTMVRNGAGSGELAVVYAQQNYATLVEPCWRTEACLLSTAESALLQTLLQQPEAELEFLTTTELGQAPFATTAVAGAKIQINRDQLMAYSVADGLGLLTLAMAAHFLPLNNLIEAQIPCKISRLSIYPFQWQPRNSSEDQLLLIGRIGWLCEGEAVQHGASVAVVLQTIPIEGTTDFQMSDSAPEVILSNIREPK
jgi:hypothetical protein